MASSEREREFTSAKNQTRCLTSMPIEVDVP